MVEEAAAASAEPDAVQAGERAKRVRSALEFPYSDLGSAVDLARTLKSRAGTSCDDEQLASWMNQSATGGTFRSRLSAARLFGLIETQQGRVTLTALGRDVLDDDAGQAACAEAFLKAPLHAALYEQLRGHTLPPAAAIERQMVSLGVPEKQKERARQTFTKSATYAGYIDQHSGRFIKPAAAPGGGRQDEHEEKRRGGGSGGDGGAPLHPFIAGLLERLPEPDTEWSVAERVKWLQTAASIFGLIYQGEGDIKVEAVQPRPGVQD